MAAFSPDSVAEWFLRLNGFLTTLNFVVHPVDAREGSRQRTDADVLGVRFPLRGEVVGDRILEDHPAFTGDTRPQLVIAEVKAGQCALNGPWTRREDANVGHLLQSIGIISDDAIPAAATALYEQGRFNGGDFSMRLVCFGAARASSIPSGALQLVWPDVLGWVFDRFKAYWHEKKQHQQWPEVGRELWDLSRTHDRSTFIRVARQAAGISAA